LAIPRARKFLFNRLIRLPFRSPWLMNWLINTPYVQRKIKGFFNDFTSERSPQPEVYPIQ
jgi:hypothetical protein